jgi:hypothetical protein
MVSQWEYQFNGIRWGGENASIQVDEVTGLGIPDLRESTEPRLVDDGEYADARFMSARRVLFTGRIAANRADKTWEDLSELAAALVPRRDGRPLPLSFWLGDSRVKEIHCIPTRPLAYAIDRRYANGVISWAAEFLAGDPRIYETELRQISIQPRSLSQKGIRFPVRFPINFGGGTSGLGQAKNDGTIPTPPYVVIRGPALNPLVKHEDKEQSLKFTITLTPDDYLSIDFVNRLVNLNGEVSRYSTKDPTSEWWELAPGVNNLSFIADQVNEITTLATVTWQSAWPAAI